jgi:hypothetical protein
MVQIFHKPDQLFIPAQAEEKDPPALLFEMMRSFVTLAKTLNLSHAVEELKSTRQTLRRHIGLLEELKGGNLFEVKDRKYYLTPLGVETLPQARKLVFETEAWAKGHSKLVDGLEYFNYYEENGWFLYLQQHSLNGIVTSADEMLRRAMTAWANSGGNLGHEDMREIRPVCNVFRRVKDDLVLAEVGENSSFVSWFGKERAESSVGLPLRWLPAGDGVLHFLNAAYWEIEKTQSLRLDHIYTSLPFGKEDEPTPICYRRLMMGAHFPDGSPAIISVVRRTYEIEIQGISEEDKRKMPQEMLM